MSGRGLLENRYLGVRTRLDKLGYHDAFPVDALVLVERLLVDLSKTSESLQRVTKRADHFSKIAQEFETGIEPFKEESVRLIKENSDLRLGILRAQEKVDETILANKSRLRDLENENSDLKLLVQQFVKRLKDLEYESLKKTRKISDLQERNLEAVVITSDGERKLVSTRKLRMEINCPAPPSMCQYCIRVRNSVEYGTTKWKDPSALDYIKIADSRIECLQLQSRCMKNERKDLLDEIELMKTKVLEREKEIGRLKNGLHTQPGGSIILNGVGDSGNDHNLQMALKASQLQLNILQMRNHDLENKLRSSVFDDHHKFMDDRAAKKAAEDLVGSLMNSIEGGFPSYAAMTLEEKNKLLEAQLSHCCKEKAKLKLLLEECEGRHGRRHHSSPAPRSLEERLKSRNTSRYPSRTGANRPHKSREELNGKRPHSSPAEARFRSRHASRPLSRTSTSRRQKSREELNGQQRPHSSPADSRLKSRQASRSPSRTGANRPQKSREELNGKRPHLSPAESRFKSRQASRYPSRTAANRPQKSREEFNGKRTHSSPADARFKSRQASRYPIRTAANRPQKSREELNGQRPDSSLADARLKSRQASRSPSRTGANRPQKYRKELNGKRPDSSLADARLKSRPASRSPNRTAVRPKTSRDIPPRSTHPTQVQTGPESRGNLLSRQTSELLAGGMRRTLRDGFESEDYGTNLQRSNLGPESRRNLPSRQASRSPSPTSVRHQKSRDTAPRPAPPLQVQTGPENRGNLPIRQPSRSPSPTDVRPQTGLVIASPPTPTTQVRTGPESRGNLLSRQASEFVAGGMRRTLRDGFESEDYGTNSQHRSNLDPESKGNTLSRQASRSSRTAVRPQKSRDIDPRPTTPPTQVQIQTGPEVRGNLLSRQASELVAGGMRRTLRDGFEFEDYGTNSQRSNLGPESRGNLLNRQSSRSPSPTSVRHQKSRDTAPRPAPPLQVQTGPENRGNLHNRQPSRSPIRAAVRPQTSLDIAQRPAPPTQQIQTGPESRGNPLSGQASRSPSPTTGRAQTSSDIAPRPKPPTQVHTGPESRGNLLSRQASEFLAGGMRRTLRDGFEFEDYGANSQQSSLGPERKGNLLNRQSSRSPSPTASRPQKSRDIAPRPTSPIQVTGPENSGNLPSRQDSRSPSRTPARPQTNPDIAQRPAPPTQIQTGPASRGDLLTGQASQSPSQTLVRSQKSRDTAPRPTPPTQVQTGPESRGNLLSRQASEFLAGGMRRTLRDGFESEDYGTNSQQSSLVKSGGPAQLGNPTSRKTDSPELIRINTTSMNPDGGSQWMEIELNRLRRELAENQLHAQKWKREAESIRDSLESTQRILAETQKRQGSQSYLPVPSQTTSLFEFTQQAKKFAGREQDFEREIITLKDSINVLDRDKDEMRRELDRKDEKLAKLQSEIGQYLEEIARVALRMKNSEIQINYNGETLREQERDLILLRRQAEASRREYEQMTRERDEAVKELRKVNNTHSIGEIERRNINTELEKKNKEADELRRQVHKYIDEVRRIEELLQAKDEEHEMILNQYRTLSVENTNLEGYRSSLERESDTVRQNARDAVLQNETLKSQLTRQSSVVKSYEEEIQRLSQQVAALETQLSSVSDSEKKLHQDSKIAHDYYTKIESSLDETRLQLANMESAHKQAQAENRELRRHLEHMEQNMSHEKADCKKLEDLVATYRENELTLRRTIQEVTAERNEIQAQIMSLNSRTGTLNDELTRYRLKCIELQTELDKLNRQYANEKSSRENAVDELRRLQVQLNTSSTNLLLTSALGSGSSRRSPSETRLPFSHSTSIPPVTTQSEILSTSPGYGDSPIAASTSRAPPQSQQAEDLAEDEADKYGPW